MLNNEILNYIIKSELLQHHGIYAIFHDRSSIYHLMFLAVEATNC